MQQELNTFPCIAVILVQHATAVLSQGMWVYASPLYNSVFLSHLLLPEWCAIALNYKCAIKWCITSHLSSKYNTLLSSMAVFNMAASTCIMV